jgi:hypothetical protein
MRYCAVLHHRMKVSVQNAIQVTANGLAMVPRCGRTEERTETTQTRTATRAQNRKRELQQELMRHWFALHEKELESLCRMRHRSAQTSGQRSRDGALKRLRRELQARTEMRTETKTENSQKKTRLRVALHARTQISRSVFTKGNGCRVWSV